MIRIVLASVIVGLGLSAFAPAADQPTLVLVQTIDSKGKPGKLDHLSLDAKRDRLFLANKANNTLDVIDLKAGKMIQQLPGQAAVQRSATSPT